jgi:Cytochrome c554 and c-prime
MMGAVYQIMGKRKAICYLRVAVLAVARSRVQGARFVSLRTLVGCAIAVLALGSALTTQAPSGLPQVSSSEAESDFPPAHWQRVAGAPPGSHYVGKRVCAGCHTDVAEAQAQTPMGRASTRAIDSDILSNHPPLLYTDGPYVLHIERKNGEEIYSASDGKRTISVPIPWAFGLGDAGQTYVFERAGIYYESRVSYYKELDGLDVTIGHDRMPPATLSDALGRALSEEEVFKCFPCHTSEGVVNRKLRPDLMQPGVTCENCHGPGSQHVEAIQNRNWKRLHIFNPARLDPGDLNDFCGTCHRTTYDVLATNAHGIRNVRFQPYRLAHSRCYDPTDKRISCIACHDPHTDLVTDLGSYDPKCLACHLHSGEQPTATRYAPACPRAAKTCVGCHMPRLSLPGSHYKFADHFIRIYKQSESYPD